MKKFLILISLLISYPALAACPIEEGGTCSIAELQRPMHTTYSTNPMVKEFSGTPEARLQPSINEAPMKQLRSFGPQPSDYSYNTSCQFGVCNPTGSPQLFPTRGGMSR